MLRLDCPYCGMRDETEFRYGGEANRARPTGSQIADWSHYLYWRGNHCGPHTELWLHVSGCRRWLKVVRDTRTNTILRVADATAVESASERRT
jgi:heterotetrameric sarcosine oxidase delta subunit